MKNYGKRIMAVLLIVAMFASFVACGKKDENQNVINAKFSEYLVAEKVGTVNRDNFFTNEGGLTYKDENGLFGVMSCDGLRDTGAVFTKVFSVGKYFYVRKAEPTSEDDIAALNAASLIDGKGNVIIPTGYAAHHILNKRYILAVTATKRTVKQDLTVMTYDLELGSTTATSAYFDESEKWYEGSWVVFDMETGEPVPGVGGTHYASIGVRGDFITYDNDKGEKVTVNSKGESLPEGAKLFDDGTYKIEGKIGEIYDSDGTKLFSYDLTGYIPNGVQGDYYTASKYSDGSSTYAIMNKQGEILSDGYTGTVTIYGDIVHSDNKIYNINGENIIEGTYESVDDDTMFDNTWLLYNNSYYTLIDKDGNVFYNASGKKFDVREYEFLFSKKEGDDNYFFSHKDQDYTIKGHAFAPWLVQVESTNYMYNLVDTMTGKTLLEGYEDYETINYNSPAYYVYATYEGGADVYVIISSSQIADVTAKKNKLYDDLTAAFEKEGISVTVNKENGEIMLDSSVLFGGDSAELTANGKTFLNKFIKAYTNVVYSDEYDGFINKTMVEGHTAPVQGDSYADGYPLSVERATNVKDYCLNGETGIDVTPMADTLEAVGYSNSKPVVNEDGSVNMDASRRVSFRFLVNITF